MNFDSMLPLEPSDVTLLACFFFSVVLAVYFGLGRPRTWVKDRLGWVIFSYSLGTVAFVGLIAYAIVFGQKVPEPVRFAIGFVFAIALVLKIGAVYLERREGRRQMALSTTPEGTAFMSSLTPTTEEVKDVTTIWYKGKRVLRTAFSTLITILPIAPQVIAIVNDQWHSELLLAVGVQAVLINSAVARIMAIPAVNAWLTKIGLGSVPASAIRKSIATGAVTVVADPKATR